MSISGSILYVSSSLIALVALVSITGSAHSIFSSWISNLACFAMGILLIPTVKHVLKQVFNTPWTQMGSENTQANDTNRRIYNLDHARLNLDLPPQSMWMNMGYWKDTKDFPRACQALLEEVLKAAGLLTPNGSPTTVLPGRWNTIVDLGFGCGDQTLYLSQNIRKSVDNRESSHHLTDLPLFDSYTGITIDFGQANYACGRLHAHNLLDEPRILLFCADAANPKSWEAKEELTGKMAGNKKRTVLPPLTTRTKDKHRWFLALDCLYHFSPSREPILNHAFKEAEASIMAFDLLLSDNASAVARFLLSQLGKLMGCPSNAFITESEYRVLLVSAGYSNGNIYFKDISEHVFAPLTNFLSKRDTLLQSFGWGLGKLGVAKKLFEWWAKSGVVRGMIVVAKYESDVVK